MLAKIAAVFPLLLDGSGAGAQIISVAEPFDNAAIQVGAQRIDHYLPMLAGRRVAVVTNQTGMVGSTHLVDTLLALGVRVVKVFAPEHGFRGGADAGEAIGDQHDARTGLPVLSLYGDRRKPSAAQLADVEAIVFDIQDVGTRFYTYISTLHLVMQAAVENDKPLVVLDRPNPNGFYVDGPVLDPVHASFVGMHPVPLVHGMTTGEYARMINGEGWLEGAARCALTVIPCSGYDHGKFYELPVKPSPNLVNMPAVYLYPSLGLFEGTLVSVGRGTAKPFQCIGYPDCPVGSYSFMPRSMAGAKDPPYRDQLCRGMDLQEFGGFYLRLTRQLYLQWIIGLYQTCERKAEFFTPFFDRLAGGPTLREQITQGMNEEEIRASWRPAIEAFKKVRAKYLLYADF